MQIARNPYLNRTMIRRPEGFFGRRREVARLAMRLAADPPQSVAVVGDRRIGKSSLLNYITQPSVAATYLEHPDKALFLFLDFQEERRPSIENFIQAVGRHVQRALPGSDLSGQGDDYDGLRQLLERLDGDGYRVILLLDEFDRVTRSSRFDAAFFAFLRSVAGHHNVAFVTSTSRDLQQLCHTQEIADSPFFNIFTTIHLGPFEPEEALELIREPSSRTPFPMEGSADLITDLGGALPLLPADGLLGGLRDDDRGRGSVDRSGWASVLEEARPHFQFYWDQMDAVERALWWTTRGSSTSPTWATGGSRSSRRERPVSRHPRRSASGAAPRERRCEAWPSCSG